MENFCGPIIQTASFCFERTENHLRGECHCGVGCAAVGHLKQLSFADKFLIEDMDYSFLDHTCVKYHTEEPFLELLCLDSIDAVNCEYENGEFPILNGIYVNLNQGKAGELHFLPGTPVRGIRVIVKEAFYNAYVKSRFPRDDLDIPYLTGMYGNSHRNPKLYMIFRQIRDSMSAGVNSEIYYESKILEILYTVTNMDTPSVKRQLSGADLAAVEKARRILDERLRVAPKIAELARLTSTSPAKLQKDFKAAFGATIHAYVQAERTSRALERIERSDEPLYIIAQDVGCKKPSRFSEFFKKNYGITPAEYRRKMKG